MLLIQSPLPALEELDWIKHQTTSLSEREGEREGGGEGKTARSTRPIIYFYAAFNLHFLAPPIEADREHKDADTGLSGGWQRSAFNLSKVQYLLE